MRNLFRCGCYCCTYCGERFEEIEDWAEHEMCCDANPYISHNPFSSSGFRWLLLVVWLLLLCSIACTVYACALGGSPLTVLVCLLNNAICGVHCWWVHSITKEY